MMTAAQLGLISIHALLAEGDRGWPVRRLAGVLDFYPRPPCGGRLADAMAAKRREIFLSTPSLRRATRQAA